MFVTVLRFVIQCFVAVFAIIYMQSRVFGYWQAPFQISVGEVCYCQAPSRISVGEVCKTVLWTTFSMIGHWHLYCTRTVLSLPVPPHDYFQTHTLHRKKLNKSIAVLMWPEFMLNEDTKDSFVSVISCTLSSFDVKIKCQSDSSEKMS